MNDVQTLLCELVKPGDRNAYKVGDYPLLPHLPYAESLAQESDPSKQPCPELTSTNCDENGDARGLDADFTTATR